MALMLIAAAMIPVGAQVAHEDPGKALPSQSKATDDEITMLLGNTQKYLDNASSSIKDLNFTSTRRFYYQFNVQYAELNKTIWQLNGSDPGYDAIAARLNDTNEGLSALIDNSDNYNHTRQLYNESVLNVDIANVSLSKILVRDRYTRIIASYDVIQSNASALSALLQDKKIDDRRLQSAMKNLGDYINWLNEDYDRLGIEANNSIVYCGANQTAVSVGSTVKITLLLVDNQKNPINNSTVNVYVNNQLIGSNTTGDKGTGSILYTVPAYIDTDVLRVQAGYTPTGGEQPGVFSSPVILHVSDIDPSLSMDLDRGDIIYGETATVSGRLSNFYGVPVDGKNIVLSIGDTPIGTAVTNENGSYAYDFSLAPDTPLSNILVHAAYLRKTNDIFRNAYADAKVLNMTAQDTDLTLNGPAAANLGDPARFNGTLTARNSKPVSGVNVSLYIDDVMSGNGTTDDNGFYEISVALPDDAKPGNYSAYTKFDPGYEVLLNGSTSGRTEIPFTGTGRTIGVQGLPLVLFKGDRLDMAGTLRTGSGAPIANRTLTVNVAAYNTTMAMTDWSGSFNVSYAVTGAESPGLLTLTIVDAASPLYSGQALLLPYDKSKVLGVLVIVVVVITGVFLVFRRRARK